MQKRLNASLSPEAVVIREQELAAPDGTVRSEPGAVKGDADYRRIPFVLRHAGKHVSVVMLHLHAGNAFLFRQLPGHLPRVVFRVQVAHHCLRRDLQQPLQPLFRQLQSLHAAHIRHIADVRGHVVHISPQKPEGILQLSANAQHRMVIFPGQYRRERCIASGPANHIGLIPVKRHYRVVRTNPNLPGIGQDFIAHGCQIFLRFRIRHANRCAGRISAGHHQHLRHRRLLRVFLLRIPEQEHVYRRVRKHHPDIGISRRQRLAQNGSARLVNFLFRQKQDGFLRSRHQFLGTLRHLALPAHRLHVPHHHRKRLKRPVLQLPKPPHRLVIASVAAEVKAADAFNGHDAAPADNIPHLNQSIFSRLRSLQQVQLRSAAVAADRLGVISPGPNIRILPVTFLAHGKFSHTGANPVVGHGVQNRQPRSAGRTVDKRMQVPPICRVEKLSLAVRASGDVR